MKAREAFMRVSDPEHGSVVLQNVVPRFTNKPGRIRWPGTAIRADTESVLTKVATAPRRTLNSRREGVIRSGREQS
jgi:crotonobetainyl-CoA:carnitine CoA-transferase CaiB-like acyl-CoA transferase